MKESLIVPLITPILAQFDLELEAVDVVPAGKRRLVRVVVDGDGPKGDGPRLDDIAAATRAISIALDEEDVIGASPYTLEVSSRGVSRPLTDARHWRRNLTRLVEVSLDSGEKFAGRIMSAADESAVVEVDGTDRSVVFGDVAKALIQVELNRKKSDIDDEGSGSDDGEGSMDESEDGED